MEIVKDVNENERYHLVERPSTLLKFLNKEIEQTFAEKVMKEFQLRDFIVVHLKAALNISMIYLLLNGSIGIPKWVNAIWIVFAIIATSGVFFFRRYLCTNNQFLF